MQYIGLQGFLKVTAVYKDAELFDEHVAEWRNENGNREIWCNYNLKT